MPNTAATPVADPARPARRGHHASRAGHHARRAGLAAFVGTTIEWYDFFIFGMAASLVFPALFFPSVEPAAGLLASFATLGVGFLSRPLGGIVFGHWGDRFGRKRTLVATLLLMGAVTTAIGLLPSYASIGIAAPVLLCLLRLVQGFALGGEWGGAVLLAAEQVPARRRASFAAFAQQGSPAGIILATAVFTPLSSMDDAAFLSWGWRIPFLLSALLVILGLVIRLRVTESPDFQSLSGRGQVARLPLRDVVRTQPRSVALGIGMSGAIIAGTYLVHSFLLAWGTTQAGLSRSVMLILLLACSVVQFGLLALTAMAALRIDPTRILVWGFVFWLVAFPVGLALFSTKSLAGAIAGMAVLAPGPAIVYAVQAGVLSSLFPTRVRYTGISLSYQLASVLFGGTAPMIAQFLTNHSGGSLWPIAGYQVALTVLALGCSLALARRYRQSLSGSPDDGGSSDLSQPQDALALNQPDGVLGLRQPQDALQGSR